MRQKLLWIVILLLLPVSGSAAEQAKVSVDWSKVEVVSKTTATLQVVVNPPLRRGSPIHDRVFHELRDLHANYVRYVPWLPYPKLGVAELEPPANGKTSWDFSLIDPLTVDFLNATAGHSVIVNFSTIPEWMFKTPKPVPYPANPDQVTWSYEQGTQFRDPSLKEVADYYARLVSWYTKGGFKDEYGHWHKSGYHYHIPYWEVLNEVDIEHHMTPQTYTRVYDAITAAIRRVAPNMKFVGLALAFPSSDPEFFDYFLNHAHHRPGTPLNMISYHFYASPAASESPSDWQYTFFDQASGFLDTVRYIQNIRQRLSPETETDTDELGAILPNDNVTPRGPIPTFYWNLCSAMYAYIYANLAKLGVQVAGESQLVGYPSQFPSVTMVNWKTGQPNARFWTLKLLRDNFGPGDKLVESESSWEPVFAQGFVTPSGQKKLLLVNERSQPMEVAVPGAAGGKEEYVDETTGEQPPASVQLTSNTITLRDFGVAAITMR